MKMGPILGRQKAFAEKIAQGHSATEAYYLAGYRAAKRETAHRAASRLFTTPAVRAHIQELRRTGDELAREQTTLTIAQKLAFLTRLVLTSSAALRDDDPLIQSHRIVKDGTTSVRMPCKLKALKMHSELAGHCHPPPSSSPEPSDLVQQLLDQIRQDLNAPRREPQSPIYVEPPPLKNPEPTPAPPTNTPTENPTRNAPSTTTSASSPAQNFQPQQTTTKSRAEPPTPPPTPLTPTAVRKLILAQIRDSNPIYQTILHPHPTPSTLTPSSPQ